MCVRIFHIVSNINYLKNKWTCKQCFSLRLAVRPIWVGYWSVNKQFLSLLQSYCLCLIVPIFLPIHYLPRIPISAFCLLLFVHSSHWFSPFLLTHPLPSIIPLLFHPLSPFIHFHPSHLLFLLCSTCRPSVSLDACKYIYYGELA